MRPTVEEQLSGMRRILDEVVAPYVTDAYAREQLGHVTTALDGLASRWDMVVPGLRAENAALAELLRRVLPELDGWEVAAAVRDRVAALARAPSPPEDDRRFAPEHERNQELRGCVADLITALDGVADPRAAPVRAAIHDTLRRGLED